MRSASPKILRKPRLPRRREEVAAPEFPESGRRAGRVRLFTCLQPTNFSSEAGLRSGVCGFLSFESADVDVARARLRKSHGEVRLSGRGRGLEKLLGKRLDAELLALHIWRRLQGPWVAFHQIPCHSVAEEGESLMYV